MIERIETGERSSKIVKHNGVAYLTGQVAEGETIQEQVQIWNGIKNRFQRITLLKSLIQKGESRRINKARFMAFSTIWHR